MGFNLPDFNPMPSITNTIASGFNSVGAPGIGHGIQQIGNGIGQMAQGNVGGLPQYVGGLGNVITGGAFDSQISHNVDPAAPPAAPGINPTLSQTQQSQIQNAADFRKNIPSMEQSMSNDVRQTANNQLGQTMKSINNNTNSRGLLYSGINQGMKGGARAQTASNVGQATSGINAGLENAANTLDAQAVETGVGIQQTQQSIQNQIYSQAMTQMNANNSMFGSALGTGLIAAMMLA